MGVGGVAVGRLTNGPSVSTNFNVWLSDVGIPNEKFILVIKANFVTLVPVAASGFTPTEHKPVSIWVYN